MSEKFLERSEQNERKKALDYLANLIENTDRNSSDLQELLEIQRLINSKRYGLVWERHDEKVEEVLKTKIPVFKELKNKRISDGGNSKYNFLLEGDNLYTLKLLNKTHKGKIDFIYIDPPYNTGNKDFKYNDKFVKPDDAYIHSKWLSFMEVRLRQAKSLLAEDGIIAVSIDNHEGYQLKLLMDEIFGEDHMAADLHIETAAIAGPRRIPALMGSVVKTTEFIFVYTKGTNKIMKRPMYDGIDGFDTHYSKYVSNKSGKLINFTQVLKETPKVFNIFKQYQMKPTLFNLSKLIKIDNDLKNWLFSDDISKRLFRLAEKYDNEKNVKLSKGINCVDDKFILLDEKGNYRRGYRYFDRLGMTNDFNPAYQERSIRGNLWKGFSADGGNLTKEGGVSFKNGKKPLRLIKQLIYSMTLPNKTITVLDFFAGSGTTGEAVMQLNAEKKGKYNFILATNDEVVKTTYQRMINTNKKTPMNFKYFKTAFVDKDNDDLEKELLKNVKALIELQYGINFEDSSFALIMKREEVAKQNLDGISKVYMRGRVHRMMPPAEQERYALSNVEIVNIPENFFGKELQGWI